MLKRIRLPEPHTPPWGWRLGAGLIGVYLAATFASLLMVTALRDDDLADPRASTLMLAGAIGGVLSLTLVYQYTSGAVLKKQESSKGYHQTTAQALGLVASRSNPLWLLSLVALAVAVAADTLALLLGKPDASLPLGLDRIEGADTMTWVVATLVYVALRPAVEGLIFQGALYPALAKRLKDNLAAAYLTTLSFAAFYFAQNPALALSWEITYWSLLYPLGVGLTTTLARAHGKSTLAAISAHAMFGLFLMLKALLTFG
jgi:hypothetical protein